MLYFLVSRAELLLVNSISHERLESIRKGIVAAANSVGRSAEEITLIGVSKFHPADAVVEMAQAGLYNFGENRVQEAAEKKVEVEKNLASQGFDISLLRWHLVGHLQSNKAAKAAAIFDVIHSVDSVELAERLGVAAGTLGKIIECLIQVNTSGEATKSGVETNQAWEVVESISRQPSLRFKGFMTIGPLTDEVSLMKTAFDDLRNLRDSTEARHPELGSLELSMGMTGDYPLAIACGATMIRIGTALFGNRAPNKQEGA